MNKKGKSFFLIEAQRGSVTYLKSHCLVKKPRSGALYLLSVPMLRVSCFLSKINPVCSLPWEKKKARSLRLQSSYSFFKKNSYFAKIYLFIWLRQVYTVACGI